MAPPHTTPHPPALTLYCLLLFTFFSLSLSLQIPLIFGKTHADRSSKGRSHRKRGSVGGEDVHEREKLEWYFFVFCFFFFFLDLVFGCERLPAVVVSIVVGNGQWVLVGSRAVKDLH